MLLIGLQILFGFHNMLKSLATWLSMDQSYHGNYFNTVSKNVSFFFFFFTFSDLPSVLLTMSQVVADKISHKFVALFVTSSHEHINVKHNFVLNLPK